MQSHIQAIHHAEEIGIAVGCQTAGTFGHEVVGLGGRVTAEFREHIGPGFNVIQGAEVTTVIERTVVFQFQAGKRQTGFLGGVAFRFVAGEFRFPTTVAGQLVINLRLAFDTETDIGLVAIFTVIVADVVHRFDFAVDVQFVAVFIINFCCLCS